MSSRLRKLRAQRTVFSPVTCKDTGAPFSRYFKSGWAIVDVDHIWKGWPLLVQTGQRRSKRVLIDVPVVIRGEAADHHAFQEETFTVTVSAHGALVMMETQVALGQSVVVMNPANWDERAGRVAYVGKLHAGLAQVAVEFAQPAPEFWPVSSPPSDWRTS
jgi:hypothetical protein